MRTVQASGNESTKNKMLNGYRLADWILARRDVPENEYGFHPGTTPSLHASIAIFQLWAGKKSVSTRPKEW